MIVYDFIEFIVMISLGAILYKIVEALGLMIFNISITVNMFMLMLMAFVIPFAIWKK